MAEEVGLEMEVEGGSVSHEGVVSMGVATGSANSVVEGTCVLHCNI